MKLKSRHQTSTTSRQFAYDVRKLKDEAVHDAYNVELQNRFQALEIASTIEEEWENIKETINCHRQTKRHKEGKMDNWSHLEDY